MLITQMLITKMEYNEQVHRMNNKDIFYSEYEMVQLASVLLNKPIDNLEYKNKLCRIYHLQNNKTHKQMIRIKLNKMLSEDRVIINNLLAEKLFENKREDNPYTKKIPGVVAVLNYNY